MDKKKIYIGEDQPALANLISSVLEKHEHYDASFFPDGLELYKKVQEEPPDMLVLDIIMPSMSGLAISRLLKFHDKYQDIPVIIMSSITDQNIRERAMEVGANIFLPKPFKVNKLMDEISRLCP